MKISVGAPSINITFIGAGSMTSHIVKGMIDTGYKKEALFVTNPNLHKLDIFKTHYGVRTNQNNVEGITDSDVIILAVKPQKIEIVCKEICSSIHQKKDVLIVSLAVGVNMNSLELWLGDKRIALIRAMPNTPVMVGKGVIGLYANQYVSDTQKALLTDMMNLIGLTVWLEQESQIDRLAAISGSGPAYVLLVMEAMQQAGESLGFSPEMVTSLVKQTILGTGAWALGREESFPKLRQLVTSKGGTTEQAIRVLSEANFDIVFKKAMRAAVEHAGKIRDTSSRES